MFCKNCGHEINEKADVCVNCGVKVNKLLLKGKSKVTAGLLALFLGGLGIHKFYLGMWWWGILYIAFIWTFIPGILGAIEGIYYLCIGQEKFDEKYNNSEKPPTF